MTSHPRLPDAENAPASGVIAEGVHSLPVRVYWEDTDAGGIVYHASFLRFMERGRTEMLRVLGLEQSHLRVEFGLRLVVRRMEIDFLAPGAFDLALSVRTSIARLGGASLDMLQSVCNGAVTLAQAKVLCVSISEAGKPMRAPEPVRAALQPVLKCDA